MKTEEGPFCSKCHRKLEETHTGPCPSCGEITSKVWDKSLSTTSQGKASLRYISKREFWEKHIGFIAVVVLIVFGSPFLGLVLTGWCSVVVGLIFGTTSFVLGFFMARKVREETRGGYS